MTISLMIIVVLGLLALSGWVAVLYLLLDRAKVTRIISETASRFGLKGRVAPFDFTCRSQSLLGDVARLSQACSWRGIGGHPAGMSRIHLGRIVSEAYNNLPVQAVQLVLIEEESGVTSQAFLAGVPSHTVSHNSSEQSFVGESQSLTDAPMVRPQNTIIEPLIFAGKRLGMLTVEATPSVVFSDVDKRLLELLAVRASLILVDAQFTDQLLRMRSSSEESLRAKTGFLANLSHEIRGPLGIILNGVELIQDGLCGEVNQRQKDTLRMVQTSGEHLLELVNDVLDYAKVEAGKVVAKPVEIPLHSFINEMATIIRSQALDKGHKLEVEDIPRNLGMLCDKRHARQVMINLLTNAVKYTPEGGEIRIKVLPSRTNRVRIEVVDNGIGIADKDKGKVFSSFERVDNQYALSQMGTGLGMPLTKKLIEVNGGAIGFDSREGVGSTFWVVMPAVTIVETPATETEDSFGGPPHKFGQGEKILLVDHNEETRIMVGKYLDEQGFAVIHARQGGEVLKILRDHSISVAIIENDLPDISGEDMVSVIRANPLHGRMPVIMLSSRAFVFDIEHFLRIGVDRCLSKPIKLRELAVVIRELIGVSA
ncbi:MAG: ATP-binding protein [bacterium]|nr:ATP-binding protein [bacterium]